MNFLRKLWPLLVGLALFIVISIYVRDHLDVVKSVLNSVDSWVGMMIYVLLGIVTVMVPFGSLLPFMPVAVALWGWQITGTLTVISWILGSQILFEFSRALGRPYMEKLIPKAQLENISSLVHKHTGFVRSLFIRMVVHGDIVSYGFGLFSRVDRWTFLAITAVGVTPGAFMYAYFGSLTLQYQVGFAVCGMLALVSYWILEPHATKLFEYLRYRKHPRI
jgi:uncharacterized membrane protein YdjX (TVP38/TMEM64 family)